MDHVGIVLDRRRVVQLRAPTNGTSPSLGPCRHDRCHEAMLTLVPKMHLLRTFIRASNNIGQSGGVLDVRRRRPGKHSGTCSVVLAGGVHDWWSAMK